MQKKKNSGVYFWAVEKRDFFLSISLYIHQYLCSNFTTYKKAIHMTFQTNQPEPKLFSSFSLPSFLSFYLLNHLLILKKTSPVGKSLLMKLTDH